MDKLVKTHRYFLRASDRWIQSVHGDKAENSTYFMAAAGLQEMVRALQPNAPQPKTDDEILRKLSLSHIMDEGDEWEISRFPGTMAIQLGRRHLPLLQKTEYYVTEKTDGLRVMFLNMFVKDFPRWEVISSNGDLVHYFENLELNLNIEDAYQKAQKNNQMNTTLTINKTYNINFAEETLRFKEDPRIFKIRRENGWSFSYVFDRNFTFYLCTEHFLFPTFECFSANKKKHPAPTLSNYTFHDVLLLDGEVVELLKEKKGNYNYTVYDVISCSSGGKKTSFKDKSLQERISATKHLITEPHHWLLITHKKFFPPSIRTLTILPKHFYLKDQLSELFKYIKRDPLSGEYLYKEYNKNDGLVFTPNSPELSRYYPGTNDFMLKWKWPDKLTVDFRIKSKGSTTNPRLHQLYFYELKEIHYKDANLQLSSHLTNAEKRYLGSTPTGEIVECQFDGETGEWVVVGVRTDKNSPNSFKVVANTLENLLEDLSNTELIHYLSCNDSSPQTKTYPVCRAYFKIEVKKSFQLKNNNNDVSDEEDGPTKNDDVNNKVVQLSISVPIDGKPVWKPYRLVGRYPSSPYKVAEDLIVGKEIIPDPKTYTTVALCEFLPALGEWDIVEISGHPEHATTSKLLIAFEKCLLKPNSHSSQPSSSTSTTTTTSSSSSPLPELTPVRGTKRPLES